jgi:hypothetical protein
VKTGGCDPRDLQLSGSLGAVGFLKYYMYTIVKISHSASLSFLRLNTPRMLSCLRVGHVFEGLFCCNEGTGASELAAGVGANGGQPGSNAKAWRSLAAD